MRPDDIAPRRLVGRLQYLRAANLVVALWRQTRDDEVALLVKNEIAILVRDQERVRPASLLAAGSLERFPQAFAGRGFQAAQLAVAAHAIDVAVLHDGSAHEAMQAVGQLAGLAATFAFPEDLSARLLGVEFQHHRAVVERGDEQQIVVDARRRNREPHADAEWLRPVNLA